MLEKRFWRFNKSRKLQTVKNTLIFSLKFENNKRDVRSNISKPKSAIPKHNLNIKSQNIFYYI